jgi:hypothetical protein
MGQKRPIYLWADHTERNAQAGMIFGELGMQLGGTAPGLYAYGGSWNLLAPNAHATDHEKGGSDPIDLDSMETAETDEDLVLVPDGSGGVGWAMPAAPGVNGRVLQGIYTGDVTWTAAWDFDGDLTDKIGALDLTDNGISTIKFGAYGGRQVAFFDDAKAEETTGAAALEITGDCTYAVLVKLDGGYPASIATILTHMASGELEAQNVLYSVGFNPTQIKALWEYGAGSNTALFVNRPAPMDDWAMVVCIRDTAANTLRLVINGVDLGTTAYTNEATGGGDGTLLIGQSADGEKAKMWIAGAAVVNSAISVAHAQNLHTFAFGGTP